jgi:CRP/FNR family cyclic AMP-dependent transcriptional regulator
MSGRVKVYVADEEGRELILDVLGPGTFFGEFALDGTARSASVACLEPSTFAVLERSTLREAIASNPDFTLEFLLKLIKRMRNATEAVKTLGLMDVYSRFVKLLNSLAVEKDGVKTIPERLTQQDLADRIGASRESVSRIIGDLTMGGYLSVKQQLITINRKLPRRW